MANEYTLGGPPPQSRSEKILMNQNPGPAQSRIEELLKNYSGSGVTPEQIQEALIEYFSKYPIDVQTPLEIPISYDGQGNYTTTATAQEIYDNAENCVAIMDVDGVRKKFLCLLVDRTNNLVNILTCATITETNSSGTRFVTLVLNIVARTANNNVSVTYQETASAIVPSVTATDNGKFLRVVNGAWAAQSVPFQTTRVAMTSTDTAPTLNPNTLYVFPEMASLAITLGTIADNAIVNEYHFIFTSGATATTLTIPASVRQPDGFTVDANHVYEVSILENCMTAQGWAVSA